MKSLILLAGLLVHGIAVAQTAEEKGPGLSYTYAELRFVDVNRNGGDGLRFNGSYELENNWLIVGGVTGLDFNNNVDLTTVEVGGGYVWHYTESFDLVSTLRFVRADIDMRVFRGIGGDIVKRTLTGLSLHWIFVRPSTVVQSEARNP